MRKNLRYSLSLTCPLISHMTSLFNVPASRIMSYRTILSGESGGSSHIDTTSSASFTCFIVRLLSKYVISYLLLKLVLYSLRELPLQGHDLLVVCPKDPQ